jgi:hypothetical protein
MTRPIFLLVALLGLSACGSQAVREPKPPPPAADPRTDLDRQNHEEPELIAPPPAYGNKVVMAQAEAPTKAHLH